MSLTRWKIHDWFCTHIEMEYYTLVTAALSCRIDEYVCTYNCSAWKFSAFRALRIQHLELKHKIKPRVPLSLAPVLSICSVYLLPGLLSVLLHHPSAIILLQIGDRPSCTFLFLPPDRGRCVPRRRERQQVLRSLPRKIHLRRQYPL